MTPRSLVAPKLHIEVVVRLDGILVSSDLTPHGLMSSPWESGFGSPRGQGSSLSCSAYLGLIGTQHGHLHVLASDVLGLPLHWW